MRAALVACLLALLLPGCDSIFGDEEERLAGERIPVLLHDTELTPDPLIADLAVRLPPPETNLAWPQPGGYSNHAMHHLALGDAPGRLWSANAGRGSSDWERLTAQPVIAEGRIFTMDTEGEVRAFDAGNGSRLWAVETVPEDEDEGVIGGGVAFYGGTLFVSTGAAQVVALDGATGSELWRQLLPSPMRNGPTVTAGRVFAVTVDNQLHVLAADDGRKLWSHSGITETAALLGSGSVAVEAGMVVVPYSSGELVALRVENGREVWSDSLASVRRADAVSALADIRGNPVIDREWVFAISHSGRMVAIDQRTGIRVWDKSIAGVETPWAAGDFLFVLTNAAELVCLSRRDGRIRWIRALPRYEDEEDKEGPIFWVGPVLAGDRLIVAGSHGDMISVSPYDGGVLGIVELSDGVAITPIVADDTLYVLTEDADLIAFR